MKEQDEVWRTDTLRVGNVEICVLLDVDTGIIQEDTVHMVFYDPQEKSMRAAYTDEEIYDLMSSLTEEEEAIWGNDAKTAVEIAATILNWL